MHGEDTDNDGDVDLDDLNYVRNNFGTTTAPVLGDTSPFDGDVDLDELNAVRNHFGGAQASVPEPGTIGLALISLLTGLRYRRRQRHDAA